MPPQHNKPQWLNKATMGPIRHHGAIEARQTQHQGSCQEPNLPNPQIAQGLKQVIPTALQFKNNLKPVCVSQYLKCTSRGTSYDEDDRIFVWISSAIKHKCERNPSIYIVKNLWQPGVLRNIDCPDIEFKYCDVDTHLAEIAELYSYTEEAEFAHNRKTFQDLMEEYGLWGKWTKMMDSERRTVVLRLLDQVELGQRHLRIRGLRAILYLVQGAFGECDSEEEQQYWERQNVFIFYENGIFGTFLELLNMEIDNSSAAMSALRKPAVSLADSTDLRLILSVLYTTCEVLRDSDDTDTNEMKRLREGFHAELGQSSSGEDLVAVTLFGMITRFCSGSTPHFPIKKVLLLLWKVLLVSLGGTDDLRLLKAEYRKEAGLPPIKEDTVEVAKTMRAASPPASASDLIEAQQQKRNRPFRRALMKQNSMDDSLAFQDMERDDCMEDELRDLEEDQQQQQELVRSDNRADEDRKNSFLFDAVFYDVEPDDQGPVAATLPRPSTPVPSSPTGPSSPPPPPYMQNKGLPWTPKVRQKDVDSFLNNIRKKFVGFPLQEDRTSVAGLPQPIHEGLSILRQHVYVSLAEVQVNREEDIAQNPISKPEIHVLQTPVEILYQAMLPNLPQYMIALLKILLAAAPTSKAKTDSINIMSDVLPEEMPVTVPQSMKLGIDVNRHKEIIVKSVSAILMLLLKHFKLNHVYQFEFVSQHLVFANCIPLVLKFFNQNIMSYVQAKNTISVIDFPSCVLGEQPDLTAETLCSIQEIGDNLQYCWRNMFSCINLLRILNKLTKWKQSRIMMLVVFKSAPILKRTLKVKHAMMQVYVLKLLKMQTKYLGRQWRKSNMKTMSAIYQKVRHRLNDDWAYGNDMDARPWDFQEEECTLRGGVDRFNNRRYDRGTLGSGSVSAGTTIGGNNSGALKGGGSGPGFSSASSNGGSCQFFNYDPVDNCIISVLGNNVELTEEFKLNYEVWLYQEVFQANVDWDQLLTKRLI